MATLRRRTYPAVLTVLFVCVGAAQAYDLFTIGFEEFEYNDVEFGGPMWGAPGTKIHGPWVPQTQNPGVRAASWSIPDENNRFWTSDAQARQARLEDCASSRLPLFSRSDKEISRRCTVAFRICSWESPAASRSDKCSALS